MKEGTINYKYIIQKEMRDMKKVRSRQIKALLRKGGGFRRTRHILER